MSKLNHFNALSVEEARAAYRVGTARALADLGMTPSEAEWALKTAAALSGQPKLADDTGFLDKWLFRPAETVGTAALVGGGLLGAASGHLRHQFENTVDNVGDPQQDELKRKIEGYRKMKRELQTARAAGITE